MTARVHRGMKPAAREECAVCRKSVAKTMIRYHKRELCKGPDGTWVTVRERKLAAKRRRRA